MKETVNLKIRRRNLNTSKGKQRWRKNIVVDDVLQEVEQIKKEKKMQRDVKKKIQKSKKNELFVIDTNTSGKGKSEPLAKDRFKKTVVKKTSIGEIKKLKKIKDNPVSKLQKQSLQNIGDNLDIWGENIQSEIKKPQLGPLDKQQKAKALMYPEAGQSINPQFKQHEKFLEKIITEQTAIKPVVVKEKKEGKIKKVKPKKKNLKVRMMEREEKSKKIERAQAHQFFQLKKYTKETKEKEEKSKEKLSKIQEFTKLTEELKAKGIVNTRDYKMKVPEFQLPTEVKSRLRHVSNPDEGKSLMREQYDNYYRRGLIGLAKGKYRKRRIPMYKYHTTDRDHFKPNSEAKILGDIN